MMHTYRLNKHDVVAAKSLAEAISWYGDKGVVNTPFEVSPESVTWLEYDGDDADRIRGEFLRGAKNDDYRIDNGLWRKTTYREILGTYDNENPFIIDMIYEETT
jgi:hypothetical protein